MGLPGINIPPLPGALTPPFPSSVGGIYNAWSGGFGSPTPVTAGQFMSAPELSQSTLNHLLNLQQQQLMMHQVRGAILSPNLLTTGSTCSASVTGSSCNRSHMTGSFPNSNLSLASDTKDTNGETLYIVILKYYVKSVMYGLCSRLFIQSKILNPFFRCQIKGFIDKFKFIKTPNIKITSILLRYIKI
jgi:hypothetical protein